MEQQRKMENSKSKGITVVVPTYNSSGLLIKTLDSLTEQSLDSNLYEVIVSDDGSNDDTATVSQNYVGKLNIKYICQGDRGFRAGKARNEGIRLAQYETILLLDSGVIASNILLKLHFDLHSIKRQPIVIGLCYGLDEFDYIDENLFFDVFDENASADNFSKIEKIRSLCDCRYDYLSSIDFNIESTSNPWAVFWTCHVSFSRSAFYEVGGFDEFFCMWGGEDVDLGIRFHFAGYKFTLIKSIETIHYPHYKNSEERKKSAKRNIEYICEKYNNSNVDLLKTLNWEGILSRTPKEIQLV